MDVLLIVAVFIALALVQATLFRRLALRGFSYSRRFPVPTATCGDTVEFDEVIRNQGPLFLPWVRLEMRIPPSFEFRTREEVDIRGNNYHKSVFTLTPFSQVTRRHKVVLHQRGHFILTTASLAAGDLLGLKRVDRDFDAPAELYVYPALVEGAEALPSSRAQGDVSVMRWIQPDPFLVNGIRAYRAGDPERDIHWAATARMGELQVKTHDYTADPKLLVIVNMQKAEDQWGDLMAYEQQPIEQAISLAATLCLQALSQGVEAGFAANMPLDGGDECAFLPPSRGAGRQEELLRALACLQIRRVRTFNTFLDQLPGVQGMDIVILSCYDSPALRERMARLGALGNSVTLRLLQEANHA